MGFSFFPHKLTQGHQDGGEMAKSFLSGEGEESELNKTSAIIGAVPDTGSEYKHWGGGEGTAFNGKACDMK